MAKVQIFIAKSLWKNELIFPAAVWVFSRIFIFIAMLLLAPHLSDPTDGTTPNFGWEVVNAWDSVHYRSIVTSGYEFVDDGNQHNLAFFPLFPLGIWLLMKLGLSFELAGTLINNIAFCAALYCIYFWVKQHCGIIAAQWVTAVVAWCPQAMFTGVVYTEGLYLFLSTAALRAFDQQQYRWTALWGALATATRPTGMALIPALAIASWKQRRPAIAYIASFATVIGILLFSLFCFIKFGHPLAFIQAQRGWRPSLGFDWRGWWNMVMEIAIGTSNWQDAWVKNPWHPLLFSIILVSAYPLWRFRKYLIETKVFYGLYALAGIFFFLVNEQFINNFLNLFTVLGGGFILWRLRKQLTPVTTIYGFCGIGLLLASGGTLSLSRLAYGIVPLSVGVGVLLSRHHRWGYLTLGLFAILLARLAVGFAKQIWVG